MGTDKAFVEIDLRPMVVRVCGALAAAGAGEVVVVGGDEARLGALGLVTMPDEHPDAGPLGGIVTGLSRVPRADLVVVLSCDLLDPSPDAVRAVVAALDAQPGVGVATPELDGRPQWLHAAWRTAAARPVLAEEFRRGTRSVWRAAAALRREVVDGVAPEHLADADSPAALRSTGQRRPDSH